MKELDFLKKVFIFSDCTEKELSGIAEHLSEMAIGGGDTLFKEGDEGKELFIVKSGLIASILKTADGSDKEIARFQEGDFFGEMSIVDNAPRSATCQAVVASVLCKMHETDFYKVVESHPRAAIKMMYKMLNIITRRLQATSLFVSDMVRWGNEASRRAVTDEVTGAYNRRYLDRMIVDCHASACLSGKVFSLIMMDLDRFREINEAYSIEVGNKLLFHVVETMKRSLRPGAVLARYGGDEFTILLPDMTCAQALASAEQIRKDVESLQVEIPNIGKPLAVTTSQGIAGFPETSSDLDTIKKLADRALYKAKEEGKNRVIVASPP
jgi:diguanylate cyclase (GGDEF)-like protein